MAGMQDFWEYKDDFFGGGTFANSAGAGDDWVVSDTSAGGTPTYERVDGSMHGEASIAHSSTSEVQNVCLSFGDKLCFDVDKIQFVEFRVKANQASLNAASQLAFGLAGDRNDDVDSITEAALFRVIGADSTTGVVVESADGTLNNDDVSTGLSLVNEYKMFKIDFSQGTSDVRFYMGDSGNVLTRVAAATTFDLSNYTGSLQPIVQLQKTSDANTDGVTVDYVRVCGIR